MEVDGDVDVDEDASALLPVSLISGYDSKGLTWMNQRNLKYPLCWCMCCTDIKKDSCMDGCMDDV